MQLLWWVRPAPYDTAGMSLAITLAAFAVTLGVLIVVHEYGHYLAARACGVRVLRFSVGFGNPLFTKRFTPHGTEWALAAFPLGGYVKMLDEREGPVEAADLPYAFNRKPVWQRMFIVVAGPAANFLLAMLIYWGLFLHGMPGVRPVVDTPPAGTAASAAGLSRGDTIERIGDAEIRTWEDVSLALLRDVVSGGQVELFARNERGEVRVHTVRVDKLEDGNLEKNFLPGLGILPAKFVQPRVGDLLPNSPALLAGLRTGDWVSTVNGVPVADWKALVKEIRRQPGQALQLEVTREGRQFRVTVTPQQITENREAIGRIGAGPYALTTVVYSPGAAASAALRKTWDTSVLSLQFMWDIVRGELSWRNLGGPVTIADYAGQTAQMGWMPYLIFLAWISTSLFVMNLLPVPVLDGGHLLYYTVEAITRRPASEQMLVLGQRIGMALLFTLLVFALYNDINRLLGP